MKLYLAQHGEAVSEQEDPRRPLTERGKQQVSRLGVMLKRAGIKVPRVMHSGKLRAMDTAIELAGMISGGPVTETAPLGLDPKDDPEAILAVLASETVDVMLVGHLPHLGRLAGLLLTGSGNAMPLNFQPGTIACLEGERLDPLDAPGNWTLCWMLRPDALGV
ncbi:MAG: phosphohistidine phosphatase SixA [Magnetovibrionaceae bacterium]